MRPDDRRYMDSHEWAKAQGELVVIGITDFAVQELCSGNEGDHNAYFAVIRIKR